MPTTSKPELDVHRGLHSSLLSIVVNFFLALCKCFAGFIGHSFALVADGIESLSDVFSSTVVYIGLSVSLRPPDKMHPYGHGKAEPVSAAIVSLAMAGAAFAIDHLGTVAAILSTTHGLPWWVAILGGIASTAVIGAVWGTLVIRLKLPSFVVTLAGLLGMEGVLLYLVNANGTGGTIRITDSVLLDLANGNLSAYAGWIVMAVAVAGFGAVTLLRDRHRRISGLVAPPLVVSVLKVAVMGAAGVVLVLVCNTDRGVLIPVEGVPYVVLIVLGVLALWTFLLGRTRFGRYLYAIGNNAEAARRAGISLGWNKLWAFTLTGLTAGIAGIIYASRLGSISNNIDGGTLVLYAVASAVIGGASLFGVRGKMVYALLGGLVIATIYNGMGLLGLAASYQYMVTALVLLAAVTIDSLARRGRNA